MVLSGLKIHDTELAVSILGSDQLRSASLEYAETRLSGVSVLLYWQTFAAASPLDQQLQVDKSWMKCGTLPVLQIQSASSEYACNVRQDQGKQRRCKPNDGPLLFEYRRQSSLLSLDSICIRSRGRNGTGDRWMATCSQAWCTTKSLSLIVTHMAQQLC